MNRGVGPLEAPEFRWRPGSAARRSAEILRSEGARALWFRILGETVYRRMVLFERRLEEPIQAVRCAAAVTISRLEIAEADEYAAFRPGADVAETRSRLEQGHQCWVARQQGALVHAIWAGTGSAWIRYLDCEIRLAPDEAYIYESYTTPALRRLNLNTVRSEAMKRYFRERSFFRLLALVVPENPAGIHATIGAGYHYAGVIARVTIGPWRRDYRRLASGVRPVVLSLARPRNRRPAVNRP
jgi:hypothetical protein